MNNPNLLFLIINVDDTAKTTHYLREDGRTWTSRRSWAGKWPNAEALGLRQHLVGPCTEEAPSVQVESLVANHVAEVSNAQSRYVEAHAR